MTATSASVTTLTATGATTLQGLTVGGNLSTAGSYGSWLKCTLHLATYGTTQADITWKTPTFSHNITGPNNSAAIQFTSAGVYKFKIQLHSNTTLSAAKDFQLQSFYSTNGSTWNVYENSEVFLPFTNGVLELWLNGMIQVATNSYIKFQILNNSGADIVFNTLGRWSFMHIFRVG
jgi:hypothetical protein